MCKYVLLYVQVCSFINNIVLIAINFHCKIVKSFEQFKLEQDIFFIIEEIIHIYICQLEYPIGIKNIKL